MMKNMEAYPYLNAKYLFIQSNVISETVIVTCTLRNRNSDLVSPIALRTAKTPYSFGRFECNRVNISILKCLCTL